jgi:nitroimidazol reductase NimA-like FMN-containing flavoprotein (pyridoxamine 5'-phosphate oxidase superfamily)
MQHIIVQPQPCTLPQPYVSLAVRGRKELVSAYENQRARVQDKSRVCGPGLGELGLRQKCQQTPAEIRLDWPWTPFGGVLLPYPDPREIAWAKER